MTESHIPVCADDVCRLEQSEATIAKLRDKVKNQAREIAIMKAVAEKRNRDLDVMHFIWCNGGCVGGAHRFCGSPDDVTEEVVALAERHVNRMRAWYRNRQGRLATLAEKPET